jgi:Phosphodiester glycosidase/FlgD Ig-like domain
VLKRGLPYAAVAVVLVFPAFAGARAVLAPGVSYDREIMFSGGRPVILHVVTTPPPSDLYRLRPVLSHGTVLGRQSVPGMQRRSTTQATTVGVNGDYFNLRSGRSSGVFLRDGIVFSPPGTHRRALAVAPGGSLVVDEFRFTGSWQAGMGARHPLRTINLPLKPGPGVALYTRAWGSRTPRAQGSVELVFTSFPKSALNTDLVGIVARVARGGRTAIPRAGAVLQARGTWRGTMLAGAPAGASVTVRLGMNGLPDGALDAIGGGPLLVRDGVPVKQAGEFFSASQLFSRQPRTAVGQLADGRLVFVVADGRSTSSFGLTNWAMARVMADLGAVTAIGFDGGGSSTLAFDGEVLNSPSDGRPRPVSNGLFLFYYGIYSPAVTSPVLSPNGDGVGDSKIVAAKVVRRSQIDLQLVRPDGSVAWHRQDEVGPSWLSRVLSNPAMPEGAWRWVVEATEIESGQVTGMERIFRVNKTLGHLRLSSPRLTLRPHRRAIVSASVVLTRRSRVSVDLLGADGKVRRVLFAGERDAGRHVWRWNGRNAAGRVVQPGTFVIRVTARNAVGTVALRQAVNVVRLTRR